MRRLNYTPALLEALMGYTDNPDDHAMLATIQEHGGVRPACSKTDYSRRTVQRRLSALVEKGRKHGLNTEYPESSTMMDLAIFGKTRLIKHDPPLPDGTVLEWIKAKESDYTLAKMLEFAVSGVQVETAKPKKYKVRKKDNVVSDILHILTIADPHLGMLASGAETGEDWNLDKSLAMLKELIDYLVDKMDYCEEAAFVMLGDLTHSDGLAAVTPRSGHQLDVSHRYFDICRASGELMRYAIDRLLDKAHTVKVYVIRGNHSDTTEWHINENLKQVYANEPRVITHPNDAYHQMFQWGKNMVVMTHGEIGNLNKAYEWITSKWRKQFGQSNFTYVMKGHVHHGEVTEKGKGAMKFEIFNTHIPTDSHHEHHMYRSLRSMSIVMLDKAGGPAGKIEKVPQ